VYREDTCKTAGMAGEKDPDEPETHISFYRT